MSSPRICAPAEQAAVRHALSPLQEGMLFQHLLEPGSAVDVEQAIFTLANPLDAQRLRAAWQAVSARHDALRTGFRWDGVEQPLAEVRPAVDVPFAIEDAPAHAADERERAIETAVRAERARAFVLSDAPLQRVRLMRFSDGSQALIWTNHHAILDGWARRIVLRDIVDAYAGRPLRPVGTQYAAHVAWLERRDAGADGSFWRAYLRGVREPTPLPVATGPIESAPDPVVVATRTLDAELTRALAALAATNQVTLTVLVQAAWALLLARHAGIRDVVLGAVRACRHSGVDGSSEIVGALINALPLRVDVDEELEVGTWLQHVGRQWAALRSVEHTPLRAIAVWSEIAKAAAPFGSLVAYDREPLQQAIRTHIDPDDVLGVRGVRMIDQTGCALTLVAAGTPELELRLVADGRRFGRDDTERLLDQVTAALQAFPAHASAPLREITLLGPAERERIAGFNRTTVYPRDAGVPELFADQVRRTPEAIAAQLGTATLTYAELAARASLVAAHLRSAGVARGAYVGLCVERSFEMLAALLGILEIGAASIALDPTDPPHRIAFMLREAGVDVILSHTPLIDALAPVVALAPDAAIRVMALDAMTPIVVPPAPAVTVRAEDAAHVMYTSGSTGMPKGAVIPHRAIVRTVRGTDYLHFGAEETFFAFVPLTFDVAILEVWGPLLNGARLVIAPPGLPSLDVLGTIIEEQGVTTLWLTTALFEQMVDEQLPRLRGLRQLIVGGDIMSPAHARRALAGVPGLRLVNVYGPTEATVLITAQPLRTPPYGPIPLGAPIPNATVYILDELQRPVPIGVRGEIYTGGDGVAIGYLNRPDLTAERFVRDPFDDRPGATMYRSGDLGRWRADGTVEFLGRVDTQVKIRGMRVELGAVDSALTEHPGVREAVAIAASHPSGEKQLVAYVVARDGARPQASELIAFLAGRLPKAMVPAFVVYLPALPRTPTGKFDRKALPAFRPERDAEPLRRAPATAAEITVAAHVADVLGIDDVGCDDDFYALGCDSLRSMLLVARLRTAFGVDLSIRDLIAAPTVARLTATLGALGRRPLHGPASAISALRATGPGAPAFFLHGDLTGGGYYCRGLAAALGEEHPFYAVAPHGTEGTAPPTSIEEVAREHAFAIKRLVPNGPILIGGFCNGGIVAYELARQLERARFPVAHVVLVDAFLNAEAGRPDERLPLRAFLKDQVRQTLERWGWSPDEPLGETAIWEEWHERLVARWERVLSRYVPGPYDGSVSLLWSDETAPRAAELTAQWRRFAPEATPARIPGSHLTSVTHYLHETGRTLAERWRRYAAGTNWEQRAAPIDRSHGSPSARS